MKLVFKLFVFSVVLFLINSCVQKGTEIETTSTLAVQKKYSHILDDSIDYRVYYPPIEKNQRVINIIYLLHGHGGSEDDWTSEEEGNIQLILDSLIYNDLIPPVVAVTFNAGNSWYVDSNIKMEQFFIQEWMPFVENEIMEHDSIDSRIIAGNSAGGYGALRFSLKYPTLFDASLLLSPATYYPAPPMISSSRKIEVFNDEEGFSEEVWQSYSYHNIHIDTTDVSIYPSFYISTGDDDPYEIVNVVVQLQSFFKENGLKYELSIVNGGHSWDVWKNRFSYDIVRVFQDLMVK